MNVVRHSRSNLQQLPPLRPTPVEELEFEGNDISFFDDLESLPQVWQCANQDNVGELLIEFFRYYSKDFPYNTNVISIRSETGWLSKESKGWQQDVGSTRMGPDCAGVCC